MAFRNQIKVARFAGESGEWTLLEDLVYRGVRDTFLIPKGFKTDFASIPRIFQSLIPKNGRHDGAAIVHDFLYSVQPRVHKPGTQTRERISRRDADRIFLRIMRELGTNIVRRNLMYAAVRIGGWVPWRRSRKRLDG